MIQLVNKTNRALVVHSGVPNLARRDDLTWEASPKVWRPGDELELHTTRSLQIVIQEANIYIAVLVRDGR